MNDNVYVFFNNLSRRFGAVFSSPTDLTAIREFKMRVEDPAKFIDYSLFRLGAVNITTGAFTACDLTEIQIGDK